MEPRLTTRAIIARKYKLKFNRMDYLFRTKWQNHPQPVKKIGLTYYYDEKESSKFLDRFFDIQDKNYMPLPKRDKNFTWSEDMKLIIMFHKIGVRYRMEYLDGK